MTKALRVSAQVLCIMAYAYYIVRGWKVIPTVYVVACFHACACCLFVITNILEDR